MAIAMIAGLNLASAEEAKDAPPAPEAAPAEAKTPTMTPEQVSKAMGYLFGYQTGQQLSSVGPLKITDIDADAFIDGLKGGLAGDRPSIPEEQVAAAFNEFQKVMQKRVEEVSTANAEASKKFIEEASKKEGVQATKSGLLYEIIEKGEGKKYEEPKDPKDPGSLFVIDYKGTLPDGTVFDENKDIQMGLQVIPGFKEALTMMPVGSTWKVYIPAELAYGDQGAGGKIGPNQALVFDLKLKDIVPAPAPATAPGSISPEDLQKLLDGASKE